jgi:type IV conjugative transfer system protein TraE
MNSAYLQDHYSELLKHRKFNQLIIVGLLLLTLVLGGSLWYSIFNRQVVVTPTVVEGMFSVTGNRLSGSGLEQHAKYFAHLFLDATPDSVIGQHKNLLLNVHPQSIDTFKSELDKQVETLKRLNVSSHFTIKAMVADVKKQKVTLTGTLRFSQGPVVQDGIKKTLEIEFKNQFGKPFIHTIKEVANAS